MGSVTATLDPRLFPHSSSPSHEPARGPARGSRPPPRRCRGSRRAGRRWGLRIKKRGVPLTVGGVLLLLEGRGEQRGVVHRVVTLRMTLRIGMDSLSGAEGLLHLGHQDDEDDEADQTEEVEDEVADEDVTADLDGLGGDHRAHSGNDERAEEAGTRE